MTGTAGSNDLRMVDGVSRSPNTVVMTILADVCSLYVRYGLASGFYTVVTAEAVADDADMVEVGRPPGVCSMAVITGIAAVDVGRVFAHGCDTVVARAAGADDLRMVNGKNGREHVGVVAVLAYVCGLNVCLVLAGCLDTVVAIDAVAGNVHVVEIRRYPTSRCVAVVASVATRNVVRRLSGRREAIVAGATGSRYLGMVDDVHRRKRVRVVAVFAHVGRRYVGWVFSGCIGAVVAA